MLSNSKCLATGHCDRSVVDHAVAPCHISFSEESSLPASIAFNHTTADKRVVNQNNMAKPTKQYQSWRAALHEVCAYNDSLEGVATLQGKRFSDCCTSDLCMEDLRKLSQ